MTLLSMNALTLKRTTLVTTLLLLFFNTSSSFRAQKSFNDALDLAEKQYRAYDFEKSLETYDSLLSAIGEGANSLSDYNSNQLARLFCFQGECYYEFGKLEESRIAFVEAWNYLQQIKPQEEQPYFSYRIPQGLRIASETAEEKAKWKGELQKILRRSDNSHLDFLAAKCYFSAYDTAFAYHYGPAISLLKQAVVHLEELGQSQIELFFVYNLMSSVYEEAGDDASALLYRKLAFSQCSEKKPAQYFREMINIAGYYLDLRQEAECQKVLREAKAFSLKHNLGNSRHWAKFFAVQYSYYNLRPQLDSMKYVLDQQLAFYEEFPEWKKEKDYQFYLNQRAGIHIRNEAFDEAIPFLNEALQQQQDEHYFTSVFLYSKVFCGQKKFKTAINILHQLTCDSYVGDYYECASFSQDTLLRVEDFTPSFTLIEYLKDKASYYQYWNVHSPHDSLAKLSKAHVDLADELLNTMRSRGRYRGSSRRIDEISAELRKVEIANLVTTQEEAMTEQRVMQAFNSSEKVKQLAISQRLHEQLMRDQDFGLPDHIIEKERKYFEELTNLVVERRIAPDSITLIQLAGRMDTVKADQQKLQRVIEQEYPAYYNLLFDPDPLTLEEIRDFVIGPNEVLLQYLEQGDKVYLVVVNQQEVALMKLEHEESLAKLLPRLQTGMQKRSSTVFPILQDLYQSLVAPAQKYIGSRNLVIVPDGQLWYLPFAALITQPAAENTLSSDYQYLVLDRDIRYLTSGRVGFLQSRMKTKPKKGSGILAMSPLSDERLGNFSQLVGSDSSLFFLEQLSNSYYDHYLRNEEANVDNFASYAPNAALLHIATHAVVDNQRPEASYFVFNNNDSEKAFTPLTAERIYGMELHAQLGVLSACRTGDGKLRRGQGVANLARAFSYAGCQNLIVNLWEVQDGVAKDLMRTFYPALLSKGMTADAAFNAAQREFAISAEEFAHPGNWAMGVYIGNSVEIDLNSQPSPWFFLLLALSCLIFCVWQISRVAKKSNGQTINF